MSFKGGYVKYPYPRMDKYTLKMDFASLYPNTMGGTAIDIVKINREITIGNIINGTDEPLVNSVAEAITREGRIIMKEMLEKREEFKMNDNER